jgi:hypothetical protein
VTKKYHYNTLSFAIFCILIIIAFSFFTFADDTDLTLFEDFDRDGLSNAEEDMLGTDSKNSDTDGDGYSDGVEIESGYNPLITAPGDRIVIKKQTVISPSELQTINVTKQISADVVSFLADAQESGETEIDSEEFSKAISEAVAKETTFDTIPPIDISKIKIKKQDYADFPSAKRDEKLREDAIEYFTAISYIFISSFPQGFFEQSTEDVQAEVMQELSSFSESLENYKFFEKIAEDSISAQTQMLEMEVPEDLLQIHSEGLYLLQYAGNIYTSGNYKNPTKDIAPMIATLAQMQGLLELSVGFQEKVDEKIEQYDLGDMFLGL